MPRFLLLAPAALCVLLARPGFAQRSETPSPTSLAEMSLEQLMEVRIEKVFSASKYEQKVTRAPASVTIVSADEIAAFGHRTVADALRSVRGVYVSNDSNYSYLGMRGFLRPGDYNMRSLVLVDGHRMNDNVYDAAYFGRENTIAAESIERIEIIRGPSSSIYGSSAFFGVINIVTKRGRDLEGGELSAEAGSFGTRSGRLSYGQRFANGWEYYFAASDFRSDGRARIYYPEFDPARSTDPRAGNGGVAENSDSESARQIFARVGYHDVEVSGLFVTREKVVPTASFLGAFNTAHEKTVDHRAYLDAHFTHEFREGLSLSARGYYDSYSYQGDYPADWAAPGDPPDIILNKDYTFGEWVGAEAQLNATFFGRHTIVTGVELRDNLHQQQVNYDLTEPRTYSVDEDHATHTYGAFVQGEFALAPAWLLNAGLRYDAYPDGFGHTWNPRFGLIYTLRPQTTIKLLHGRAFRAPNAYERFYYYHLRPTSPNPESIHTTELAVEHYFNRDYHATVSAYEYHISDFISQLPLPDGHFYFGNSGMAKAMGLELEAEAHLQSGWRARASYARQRTEEANGTELTNSPRDLAKLGLIVPLAHERVTAGLELQYEGSVRTLSGGRASSFTLGNLTITARRLAPGLDLSASVYNLFDARYGYPGAEDHAQETLPQEGRNLRVELRYRF